MNRRESESVATRLQAALIERDAALEQADAVSLSLSLSLSLFSLSPSLSLSLSFVLTFCASSLVHAIDDTFLCCCSWLLCWLDSRS
jgi:hypothetical protein